jgi:hypothetical protein
MERNGSLLQSIKYPCMAGLCIREKTAYTKDGVLPVIDVTVVLFTGDFAD